jgi:hypothetical protein
MKSTVHIEVGQGLDPFGHHVSRTPPSRFREFIGRVKALTTGGLVSRGSIRPSAIAGTAHATGTVTLANVSAADTVTLNGQNLTAVAGAAAADQFSVDGNDIVDATGLVTAINASAQTLISGIVRASNQAATITLASVAAGEWVEVAGTRFTATPAATGVLTDFSIAGNDAADATALAAAINAHPSVKDLVLASAASNVVTVRQLPPEPTSAHRLVKSGAGITLSGSALAASAVVLITAVMKGKQGNAITLASNNGTRLAVSGARLTGGTQSAFTF